MLVAVIGIAAAEPSTSSFPYEVATRQLANGLEVVVVPMPSDGVVAFYTWMAVGSRDEVDPGKTGFAHFFEHLMFYGTASLGGPEREREVLRLGADENAWTWFDETVYHGVLSVDRLERYVEIEADRFQRLALAAEDVRREAGAVYGEYRKGSSDPAFGVSTALWGTAFQVHPYGHDTIGFEADIKAMPANFDYAMAFFDRFYRPENARVLVVGDVQPDQAFALVEKHFGSWTRGTTARPVVPEEPTLQGPKRVSVAWTSPTAARLAMGWRVGRQEPALADAAALELAGDLLLSPVGPLQERLIRVEGLAYEVSGGRMDLVDPTLFTVEVVCKSPDDLERVEAIVREEVAALAAGVDESVLARTRDRVRYELLTSLDSPGAVADLVGWHLRRSPQLATLDAFHAAYAASTPADVARVVGANLIDAGLTVVTLVPPAEPGEEVGP